MVCSPNVLCIYSHPPKASYGVASPRRTKAYCLRRRALSETFGGWLYTEYSANFDLLHALLQMRGYGPFSHGLWVWHGQAPGKLMIV